MKRFVSVVLAIIMVISINVPLTAFSATYEQELIDAGFTSSYASALSKIHSKYPNWVFKPLITNLSWTDAVNGERKSHTNQLILKSSAPNDGYFCKCSSCYKNGSYVTHESGSCVSASEACVAYYLDPRNWISVDNVQNLFQFLSIKDENATTTAGVETVLKSTWMYKSYIKYLTTSGLSKTYTKSGSNVMYSTAINDAAKYSGLSPYFIASKIVQEVGASTPKASGVVGNIVPFTGIYNYYSIGANAGGRDGLAWACGPVKPTVDTVLYADYDSATKTVSGKETTVKKGQTMSWMADTGDYYKVRVYNKLSANTYSTDGAIGYIAKSEAAISGSYNEPWTNPYKSIYNGAKWIANNYGTYQYTGYLMKFNVMQTGALHSHEYMATISSAVSESKKTYNAYNNAGSLTTKKIFYIPVYKNMPSKPCPAPTSTPATVAPSSKPSQVTGLALSSAFTTAIKLTWSKLSNATAYYVYSYDKTAKKYTRLADITNGDTTYTATGLSAGKEYTFAVKAGNSAGYGAVSDLYTVSTKPAKPTGLTSTANTTNYITIKWEKVTGATGYVVYRYSSVTKKYTKVATVKSSVLTYTQSKLNAGSAYSYAVSALTSGGEGAKSAVYATATKCAKVAIKTPATDTKHTITAKWTAPSACTGYQVQFSRKSNFSTVIATKTVTPRTAISYKGKNFTKGVTYYVRVRAYKTAGGKNYYGAWSTVKSIKSK